MVHTLRTQLEADHTAFGWVESGEDAMDRLLKGDRLIRAHVEPDPRP